MSSRSGTKDLALISNITIFIMINDFTPQT